MNTRIFSPAKVDKASITAGIHHWMKHTCIKFTLTNNTAQPHLKFVYGIGCHTVVGRDINKNGQDVSLGKGCTSVSLTLPFSSFVLKESYSYQTDVIH